MHWKELPRLRFGDEPTCFIGPLIAMLGASVVGAGASLLGANKAAKATEKAAEANTALAREQYNRNSENLQPYIDQGYGANELLAQQLGIGGGQSGSAGSAGGYDWNAYLQQHPEVAAEYEKVHGPGLAQGLGIGNDPNADLTPEQFAAWHYQRWGQDAGWEVPTVQASQATAAAPAVGGGSVYGPDVGTRPTFAPLDVSVNAYQQSPDFQFQMDRGLEALKSDKTLNGLLNSGSALKSALDFSQNLALGDYNQWRDYTTNRYDTNRAFDTGTWEADRNYDTSRFDTKTNDLMRIAGQGLSGANALAGAGTSYINTAANANDSAASASANAALAGSSQLNSLLGNLAYAYGSRGSSYGGGGGSSFTAPYNGFARA